MRYYARWPVGRAVAAVVAVTAVAAVVAAIVAAVVAVVAVVIVFAAAVCRASAHNTAII